jgi:hypothetical protein
MRQCFNIVLLTIFLLAITTACSGPDHAAGLTGTTGANAGGGLLAGLPGLPQDAPNTGTARHVSAYQFLQADLYDSNGATMTGAQLNIDQSGLCYAILGADTGGQFPSSLTLSGTMHGLWVGVSDYANGVWKWLGGPRDSGGVINLPASGTLSAGNKIYIALVCPLAAPADQAWANITAALQIDALPDVWNFMVWISGDNDLAVDAVANLNDMEQANSSDGINILAGYDIDRSQAPGVTGLDKVWFIKVAHDNNANRIVTNGNAANMSYARSGYNSADPAKLAEFITWARTNFPAQRNALILWDHGDGWLPGWKSASSTRHWQRPRHTSGILCDLTDGDYDLTDNTAVAAALSGLHLDLLCFDACNMSQIEALYDFRGAADWISASEVLVPSTGYPYAAIINNWIAALPATPQAVAKIFADDYKAYYNGGEYACQATLDMGQLDSLTTALKGVASAVIPQAAAESSKVRQAISTAFLPESSDGERDLRGFLESYRGLTSNTAIQAKLDAALTAYDAFDVYFQQYDLNGATGVAAYLPALPFFSAEYQDMYAPSAFNAATGWLDMLSATGVPEGSGAGVVVNWQPGYRIEISWSDAGTDIDLGLYDPLGNFGAPWDPAGLAASVIFSPDNMDAGQALEWGKLKNGAPHGAYYLSVASNENSGPSTNVTVKLYDSDGTLKQDLGLCTVAAQQYIDYATLEY